MMRWLLSLVALTALGATAAASPPPLRSLRDAWSEATRAARAELAACKTLGGAIFGDVDVTYDARRRRWSSSSSKSLGKAGPKVARCMQEAIARHFPLRYDLDDTTPGELTHVLSTGLRGPVLPPAATLLPIWRRAMGQGKDAARARAELVQRLPPDYRLTRDRCLATDRPAISDGQYAWLPTTGAWIPPLWHAALKKLLGADAHAVVWSAPGELVMKRGGAVCLVAFEAAKQAALRAEMERVGSCWVGGFEETLLRPRVAFPTGERYTSLSTFAGQTCATTVAGKVVCCGAVSTAVVPAGLPAMRSVTLGYGFACGLEQDGAARCWGAISAPPADKFSKLSAGHDRVCGLTKAGQLACWGAPMNDGPPVGSFTDVAVAQGRACAVRSDGSMACWGQDQQGFPPGSYTSVAASWTQACAVRSDGLAACWRDDESAVDLPLWELVDEVAISDGAGLCGRRHDSTVRCTLEPAGQRLTPAPAGKMLALAGHQTQMCGLRDDRSIACWGDPWPTRWNSDNTWPYTTSLIEGVSAARPPTSLDGRVSDERGRPLAGAEVLLCRAKGLCDRVADRARASSESLAAIVRTFKDEPPSAYAHAITDQAGRWTTPTPPPLDDTSDRVDALFTGSGRELVSRSARVSEVGTLGADLRLRPAVTLSIAARCPLDRCTGALELSVSPRRWHEGSSLARLSPGTYVVRVARDRNQPKELRGQVVVDVTYAAKAQQVALALRPSGTGKSISGTASLDGKTTGVEVIARCGASADDAVYRVAVTDDRGHFELKDVGAPPCHVRLAGSSAAGISVSELPAAGLVVRGAAIH